MHDYYSLAGDLSSRLINEITSLIYSIVMELHKRPLLAFNYVLFEDFKVIIWLGESLTYS